MKLSVIVGVVMGLCVSMTQALTATEMSKQVNKNGIVKITDKNYDKLLNHREDYYVAMFVTASSAKVGCSLCSELVPVINTLASSYAQNSLNYVSKSDQENKPMFFAIADASDNRKFFGELGLQTVPKVFLYKPTVKKTSTNIRSYEEYSFLAGDHYTNLVGFIIDNSQLPTKLFERHEPADYSKILTRISFMFLGIVTIYKMYYKFDKIFKSTFIYAFLSLLAIFALTAGYMFNQIRGTPYSRPGSTKEQTMYFAPGHQQQMGAETQAISIVYFALFGAMWILINKISVLENKKTKFMSAMAVNVFVFALFSLLVRLYHVKNGGYPFYLSEIL